MWEERLPSVFVRDTACEDKRWVLKALDVSVSVVDVPFAWVFELEYAGDD